jgi:hypothetical protein
MKSATILAVLGTIGLMALLTGVAPAYGASILDLDAEDLGLIDGQAVTSWGPAAASGTLLVGLRSSRITLTGVALLGADSGGAET